MRDLVRPDQTGFMPHASTRLNLRRLHNNLAIGKQDEGLRVIVSLDANKAIDSVEWPYLLTIIAKMGFGPKYIMWIGLLYIKLRARVKLNV